MSFVRAAFVAVQAIANHFANTAPNPSPIEGRYHTDELLIFRIAPQVFEVSPRPFCDLRYQFCTLGRTTSRMDFGDPRNRHNIQLEWTNPRLACHPIVGLPGSQHPANCAFRRRCNTRPTKYRYTSALLPHPRTTLHVSPYHSR
jgi:hypothetical protein